MFEEFVAVAGVAAAPVGGGARPCSGPAPTSVRLASGGCLGEALQLRFEAFELPAQPGGVASGGVALLRQPVGPGTLMIAIGSQLVALGLK
jgi:hypothetical protein